MNIPKDSDKLFEWLNGKIDENIRKVLKENKIGGEIITTLTNRDLIDLLPDNFLQRKELWEFIKKCTENKTSKHSKEETQMEVVYDPPSAESSDEGEQVLSRKNERSPSTASTSSVRPSQSSDESEVSFSQAAGSSYASESIWDDFTFPVASYVNKAKRIDESTRNQMIRDAYTCMLARVKDNTQLSSLDFRKVAQKMCQKMPILKDECPPSSLKRDDLEFPYWGTVEYQLRKRHNNKKKSKKNNPKKQKIDEEDVDIEKHNKQIAIELRKKTINKEVVNKLQEVTFNQRVEHIMTMKGTDAVDKVVEKYPFLQREEQFIKEVELHLQELTDKDSKLEDLINNWKEIAHTLVKAHEDYSEDDYSGVALENLHNHFGCKPVVYFIEEGHDDVDKAIKSLLHTDSPCLAVFDDDDSTWQIFCCIDRKIFLEMVGLDYGKAVIILIGAYYVFNLRYDQDQKLLFQFVEEFVLGIKPLRSSLKYKKICNKIFSK